MLMKDLKRMRKNDLPIDELRAVEAALSVQPNSFAPATNYKVGAAVLDTMGDVHVGVNVENHIGKVTHAEEYALGAMVAKGRIRFAVLVCVSPGNSIPCGSCLEIMKMFADSDLSKTTIIGVRVSNPSEVVRCTFEEALQVTDAVNPDDIIQYFEGFAERCAQTT